MSGGEDGGKLAREMPAWVPMLSAACTLARKCPQDFSIDHALHRAAQYWLRRGNIWPDIREYGNPLQVPDSVCIFP